MKGGVKHMEKLIYLAEKAGKAEVEAASVFELFLPYTEYRIFLSIDTSAGMPPGLPVETLL